MLISKFHIRTLKKTNLVIKYKTNVFTEKNKLEAIKDLSASENNITPQSIFLLHFLLYSPYFLTSSLFFFFGHATWLAGP